MSTHRTENPSRELTPDERWYSSAVHVALHGLTRTLHRSLMQILRQNLAERPPCDSSQELVRDLGEPSAYAADLLADAERAEPGILARSRRRHRIRLWSTVAATAVLLAVVAFGTHWWLTWDAGFSQFGQRLCAGQDGSDCDQTGFVSDDLAQLTRVPCAGTLTLTVDIAARSDVSVTSASIPGTRWSDDPVLDDPHLGIPMVLDDVQAWKRPEPTELARPSTWPATTGPFPDHTQLHFHLTLCPRPGRVSPGSSAIIDRIQVDYRALGRSRTAIVPLMQRVAVTVPSQG